MYASINPEDDVVDHDHAVPLTHVIGGDRLAAPGGVQIQRP
jgi:hypothetical protein